ncbi:MAG TPA: serine/threonine-protein kinase [Pyrinomonadaceae bacterium]|nr:serine/threonine-protein kinase [Pyrinomonadaceae bacterium]
MRDLERYVGHVLDGKYHLERLLGQGGMGAVYLATHLGTERYVALKLIAPEFMRNDEFVERFKREARAAGRLRHPNVVDVTDFGFAQTGADRLAYLVMEYLDGCTLGDVLAEEERLPLEWVVDILEQVCSAVHEAHRQGIVHRDLKPDNIWLEPNRLGGYRVKVLDFGIAKLGEANEANEGAVATSLFDTPLSSGDVLAVTVAAPAPAEQLVLTQRPAETDLATEVPPDLEIDTLLLGHNPGVRGSDGGAEAADFVPTLVTVPLDAVTAQPDQSSDGEKTQLFSSPAKGDSAHPQAGTLADSLNEFDGTRLYYQRTQRLGENATARPRTAATDGLTRVGTIMGTPIYMSPEQCRGEHLEARADVYSLGVIAYQMLAGAPPFAGDMTTVMRLHIESAPRPLRELARRLPKRVSRVVMSALAKNPSERPQTARAFANSLRANADGLGALYRRAFALYSEYFPKFLKLSLIAHIPVIVLTLLMVGWEFANKFLHPQGMAKVLMICVQVVLGLGLVVAYFLAASAISGMTAVIVTQLSAAPLRPVELRTAFALLKRRWRPFLNTSIRMTLRIMFFSLLGGIPGIVVSVRYALYAPVVLMEGLEKKAARLRARELGARSWKTVITVLLLQFIIPVIVSAVLGRFSVSTQRLSAGITVKVSNQLSQLLNIVIIPLMSIVPALLYLKMRQMGGETLNEAIAQIEEVEAAGRNWQQRMRTRLTGHTPVKTQSASNR